MANCRYCGTDCPGQGEHDRFFGCTLYTDRKPTNADRIRAMSDEEMAEWMLKNISCDKEAHMCLPEMYKDSGKCNGNCRAGHLAYLRQPEKEDTPCR